MNGGLAPHAVLRAPVRCNTLLPSAFALFAVRSSWRVPAPAASATATPARPRPPRTPCGLMLAASPWTQRGGGGPSLSNLGAARVLVGLPPRHVHTLNRPAGWQSGTAGPAPPRPTPIARRCHARYPRGACCTPAGACMPAPTVCVRVVRMQRAGGASLGAEPGWCVAGVCALPALPWRILPAAQAMERPARVEHVQHHGGRWTDPPAPFATDTGTNA
jgi:hypothetical protein